MTSHHHLLILHDISLLQYFDLDSLQEIATNIAQKFKDTTISLMVNHELQK
jgi:hypothetical protein